MAADEFAIKDGISKGDDGDLLASSSIDSSNIQGKIPIYLLKFNFLPTSKYTSGCNY